MTASEAPASVELPPAAAWSQRVRRVGGFIQLAFAAFWLVRGALSIGADTATALTGVAVVMVVAVLVYGIRVTAGTGRRPSGPEAKRIERSVTMATIIELVASFVFPVIVITDRTSRLGPAVHRHHHRTAAVVARPPGPYPPVSSRRLGPDHRTVHPGGHHVRDCARGDDRAGGRCPPAGHRRRRFPRPGQSAPGPLTADRPAQHRNPVTTPEVDIQSGRFRPFFNPATGEHIQFAAVAEDSDGHLVRFNWRSVPGGVITEHIHPHQEERFTITAGEARFTLHGQEHLAGAGQTVVVPAGVPHSEGNSGSVDIEGVVELRPALLTKEFHEAVAGLVADGHTTPRGAPKNPLQLGATFWHFRHESRVTTPAIWVQNLMLPTLWALAKVFGVKPYYPRWDTRIRE